MENEAMETIEMLYSMISEARRMPLAADKVIVERDAILGMLEELRDSLPVEISEAKRLLSAKDEFISNAKREAEQIRKTAEDKARALVEEEEIVKIAKLRSAEITSNTEQKCAELRKVANEYVDDTMRRTEEAIMRFGNPAPVSAPPPALLPPHRHSPLQERTKRTNLLCLGRRRVMTCCPQTSLTTNNGTVPV